MTYDDGIAERRAKVAVAHHNLPVRLTSFVGREREIAEVGARVSGHRLITLVGAPGVGKTRLGLQVAAALLVTFPHGAWMVELAPLAAPELVARAVADVLGVRERPGQMLTETLAEDLRERQLLLLLDNCEHLIEASAVLVEALLQRCPGLHVLATSREPLAVDGERLHRVSSLSVPDVARLSETGSEVTASIAESESVQLFVELARAGNSAFALTDQNALAVASICARLDGIPLALELAAARVRALSLEQIASRLNDQFRLLTGGRRTVLPRLQTLGGAIDWSYALLAEPEQVLLRRLAVFAGSFSLDAIEGDSFWVSSAMTEAGAAHAGTVDVLLSLIDKSLVQVEESASGEKRYRLLEMIRQYGLEKLAQHGDLSVTRDRHRDYFLRFAEEHGPAVLRTGNAERLRLLDAEHDNLRAALGWCLERAHQGQTCEPDDVASVASERGLRLAGALHRYWNVHVHQREGRRWLEQFLALPVPTDTPARCSARAEALHGAAFMMAHHGEYWGAVPLLEESANLFLTADDVASRVAVLGRLSLYLGNGGAFDRAVLVSDEVLATARRVGNPELLRQALLTAAYVSFAVGDLDRASSFGEECVALGRALGSTSVLSYALQIQCRALAALGDLERAQALAAESFEAARSSGNTRGVADAHRDLGHIALSRGEAGPALGHYQASLEIVYGVADRSGVAMSIRGVARSAMRLCANAYPDAALARRPTGRRSGNRSCVETERLLGAVRLFSMTLATIESLHYALAKTHREEIARDLTTLRETLGEATFEEAWEEGRSMPFDRAVEYARNVAVPPPPTGAELRTRSPAPGTGAELSRREEQVAALVAEGLSNPQIAARLDLSDRTVDAHLRNIMGKLDVTSRAQVAAWIVRHGLTAARPDSSV